MRQSDGSEILGPNDPRNVVIGIIHVSPNDDRQSVVNAITAQDRAGRDQIVLDLPAQNKSFKNVVDFAGLHQMASELDATIVLIAPEKSKIANLAHRESFTVYPTLEELTSAEFPPLEPDGEPSGVPAPDDEMDHTMMFPLEIPNASSDLPTPAVPPAPAAPSAAASVPPPAAPPTPAVPPAPAAPPAAASVPPPATPAPMAVPPATEDDEEITSPSLAVPVTPSAVPAVAQKDEEATDPSLAAASRMAAPATPDPQVVTSQPSTPPTGNNLPAVVPFTTGALVAANPNSQLPTYYEPIDVPRRRSWRGLIITGVTILVLIALGVLFYRPILDLFFPPTATVIITPNSQQLQHTYQITAVLGVPDPTQNQVDARALYADSPMQMQTVRASGQGHIAGQQARGELTFYNTSASSQTVAAGTIVFDPNGLAVVNDQTVTLPALNAASGLPGLTVPAHTVNTGSAQNIAANDFNNRLCCNGAIYVTNAQAFTGGEDQQSFTYVQQSDIDGVVQSMETTQAQQATQALQAQVRQNEKPVSAPRCSPQVKSDHAAGEQAPAVMVSVTTSCVGEVYDMQAVQVLAARKLTQDAETAPGAAYAPVGNIAVQVQRSTPDIHGNVLLVTNAVGIWAYQFTPAQRAHFARLIANKSEQDARGILLGQTGIQNVTITLTGVSVTTVPDDLKRITINIEAIQGLHS